MESWLAIYDDFTAKGRGVKHRVIDRIHEGSSLRLQEAFANAPFRFYAG